ncbi:hypothetical protein [Halalkalibacter flavus]|uniref:hypothetical protein n=1 Tax=Halalkalibacter flavus TaxID=3090668 RepID=UPI002FCC9534
MIKTEIKSILFKEVIDSDYRIYRVIYRDLNGLTLIQDFTLKTANDAEAAVIMQAAMDQHDREQEVLRNG